MSKYIIVGPGASGKDYLQKKMIDLGIELTLNYNIEESYANDLATHSDYLEKKLCYL